MLQLMSMTLTPTSYLVLGCVAANGPLTPYDLKQMVSAGVGNFWSFPHSQLYSEPSRLTEAGLLIEEREETGRRRRSFAITEAGRHVLREWLGAPTSELPEIRDIALLKLFFGSLTNTEDIVALARAQHGAHVERAEEYEKMAEFGAETSPAATLRLGIAWERAAAGFWAGIMENPPK